MGYNKSFEAALEQLALDYNCERARLSGPGIEFFVTPRKRLEGRRIAEFEESPLRVLALPGRSVITCTDELTKDMQRAAKGIGAEWIFETECQRALDGLLEHHGLFIADVHEYWLPERQTKLENAPDYDIVWYDREGIKQFEEEDRFSEAYLFDERRPDMIGVAAVENGRILGMAGASTDSDIMYQMGVNVEEEGRGRGVAFTLVTLLKNAILDMGKIPLYGMVNSHMISKRMAWDTGFKPAWAECYAEETE